MAGTRTIGSVPEEELFIAEVEAGRGKIEYLGPVTKSVVGIDGKLDRFLEHQAEDHLLLVAIGAEQARMRAEIDERFKRVDARFDGMAEQVRTGFDRIEKLLVAQSNRVLNGVKAQLEEHRIPVSEAERRGYGD